MPLNPLAAVTDYQSMLNRIFWFTTAFALGAIWILRLHAPPLDALLSRVDVTLALQGDKLLPTPGGYLLPALAIGIATRIFRLHARISDWLGIRECFDLEVIIGEMAARLGVQLDVVREEQLRRARHSIMRKGFYPYVSGPHSQVDQQLILQALDAWSWFWVGVEGVALFAATGLGLIAFRAYEAGFILLGAALLAAVFALPAIRNQCKRYAVAQVRAILADPARAATVHAALAEAMGLRSERRLAA